MTHSADVALLISLIKAALIEAERQDDTLAAALLEQCLFLVEQARTG